MGEDTLQKAAARRLANPGQPEKRPAGHLAGPLLPRPLSQQENRVRKTQEQHVSC